MSEEIHPPMRLEIAVAIKKIPAIGAKAVSNAEKEKELDELMRSLGECSNLEAKDIAIVLRDCRLSIFAGKWLASRFQAPRKNGKIREGTPGL